MGVSESHENVRQTLVLLKNIDDQDINNALNKLEDLNKNKLQMQISKWDCLLLLPIDALEVKKILQMLSGRAEPSHVAIHLLELMLLLSRKDIPPQRKILRMLNIVCFEIEPNYLQDSEVRYFFHLVYQQICAATLFKITDSAVEQRVMSFCFKDGQAETTEKNELATFLSQQADVGLFLDIFTRVGEATEESSEQSGDGSSDEEEENQSPGGQKEDQAVNEEAEKKAEMQMKQSSVKVDAGVTPAVQTKPRPVLRKEGPASLQLNWNSKKLANLATAYSVRMALPAPNPTIVQRMSAKLRQLRVENKLKMNEEMASNIIRFSRSFGLVEAVNLDFYGQRQLTYMMKSLFFTQHLENNSFSIQDFVSAKNFQINAQQSVSSEEVQDFERVMVRAQTAYMFKEFYKQNLSELKFELKMHQSRLLFYLCAERGKQRLVEKRKHKFLGEISMLTEVIYLLNHPVPMNLDTDSEDDLDRKHKVAQPKVTASASLATEEQKLQLLSSKENISAPVEKLKNPTDDDLFRMIYSEFGKLRSCGLDRKSLVTYIDLKGQKSQSKRMLQFWAGIRKVLALSMQLKTFLELPFFLEFQAYVDRSIQQEEKNYIQILAVQQDCKQNFKDYCTQIGRLKALDFVLKLPRVDKAAFSVEIATRMQKLIGRMEEIDIKLVEGVYREFNRKRSQKLFFKATGQVAAYKCICKGLDFEHVSDYLLIALVKMRIWETLTIVTQQDQNCTQDPSKQEGKPTVDTNFLKSVFILQRMKEFDTDYNLEGASTESQTLFEKFQDDLIQTQEEERLASQAPDVPTVKPIEETDLAKPKYKVALHIIEKFYHRVGLEKAMRRKLKETVDKKLQFSTFDLIGKMSYRTLDVDNAGQILFDFVDIEDRAQDPKGNDFVQWLGQISHSLAETYFNSQVEVLRQNMSSAHKKCKDFCTKMNGFTEENFVAEISTQRYAVYRTFIETLKLVNKGCLLNGFDLHAMSLPLEHSLLNNYWVAQALNVQINYFEKQEKYNQLVQANSPVLLSRRSAFLNQKVAYKLILAAFQLLPQGDMANSGRTTGRSNMEAEQQAQRDFEDFEHQYRMTKGEEVQESRIKQQLFGELQSMISVVFTQSQIEQQVATKILHSRDEFTDLGAVVGHLYDQTQNARELGDLSEAVQKYQEVKIDYFNKLKSKTVSGMIGGSKDFLDAQIARQTALNQYGENNVMRRMSEYVDQIHNQAMAGHAELVAQQKVQSNRIQLEMLSSAHSDGSDFSLTLPTMRQVKIPSQGSQRDMSAGSTKSGGESKKPKRTVTQKGKPIPLMQQVERNLTVHLTKSFCYYRLIQEATGHLDLKSFYHSLNVGIETRSRLNKRVETVLLYLQKNSDLPQEVFPLNELELGARLMQDVQAGTFVNPVYVYDPSKVDQNHSGNQKTQSKSVESNSLDKNDDLPEVQIQKGELTSQQQGANQLLNYLNNLLLVDDKLSSKLLLKNDNLFGFLQVLHTQINQQEVEINLTENIGNGLGNLLNVFEIQHTPLEHYMKNYERVTKFVTRDLLETLQNTDEGHLKFSFFDIMSKKGQALFKLTMNRFDSYFNLVSVDESDKLDFGTAQGKIKRELDQNLRTFKEFIDLEENKKVAQAHQNVIKHQELRLVQEIAAMVLLVRVYYLKQEQLVLQLN